MYAGIVCICLCEQCTFTTLYVCVYVCSPLSQIKDTRLILAVPVKEDE